MAEEVFSITTKAVIDIVTNVLVAAQEYMRNRQVLITNFIFAGAVYLNV